jgi:ribosome-associated toxin RatA of RatAB toxin-antitoxin module
MSGWLAVDGATSKRCGMELPKRQILLKSKASMGPTRLALIATATLLAAACAPTQTRADWSDSAVARLKQVPDIAKEAAKDAEELAHPATDESAAAQPTAGAATRPASTEKLPIEGSDLVRGRSTVLVNAPLSKVRKAVLAFRHYAKFMPHYRQSSTVGKLPNGNREVYMQVAALNGAVKMWARLEMVKTTPEGGVEVYTTKFIEGNVDEFSAIWRLEEMSATQTKLTLDVFLEPSLPLPTSLLNDENVQGAEQGVIAMRKRAESL